LPLAAVSCCFCCENYDLIRPNPFDLMKRNSLFVRIVCTASLESGAAVHAEQYLQIKENNTGRWLSKSFELRNRQRPGFSSLKHESTTTLNFFCDSRSTERVLVFYLLIAPVETKPYMEKQTWLSYPSPAACGDKAKKTVILG